MSQQPQHDNQYFLNHLILLEQSLRKVSNKSFIIDNVNCEEDAQKVYASSTILLSHNNQPDPVFNYANKSAHSLFEMDWDEFTSLPSKFSAEAVNQQERQKLLDEVSRNGYISNYTGIRIAKSGKRFYIRNALVWNVFDNSDSYIGQAAMFDTWEYIE
jgi:benzoyl-CoA reductase/2-hydroxyglutaryl-CoA dehydratase subunit BcrC/BadD/HgdB